MIKTRNYRINVLWVIGLSVLCGTASANQISGDQQQFVQRYEKQTRITPPEEALLNTDPEPDLTLDFVELYNGRDLEGWVSRGGECTFEAQGDIIVGTTIPGQPTTFLCTEREDYGDFIFTAEIKWVVPGNSGIQFRSGRRDGKDGKPEVVFGPQAELEPSGERNWSGGVYGQSAGGWRYPLWLDAHKEARAAIRMEDFNRITIEARGDTIKTWINGIPAAHWKTDEYQRGLFGLQVHSGKEGTIQFRNIRLKELDPG